MNNKTFFFGKGIKDINLKRDLFAAIVNASLAASIGFFIISLLAQKDYKAVVIYAILVLFYLRTLLLIRNNKNNRKQGIIYTGFCITQSCILFPALYITGGGIDSGVPLLFMFGAVVTILLLDGLALILVLLLTVVVYAGAYGLDYYNPGFTDMYTIAGDYTYIDISLTVITVGIGIGLFLRHLTKKFDADQEKSRELLFQIEDSSTRDPLTGAYNRRYLMEHIDDCIAQVESGEMRAFSILMFDIDHFKRINDTYGHLAGDDCIRNLSCILKNSLRNVDVVSRYGGEEFICVLPTAEDTPAFRRAEQIRESVELTQLSEEIDKKITISGGVVMYTPGMTPEELINEADENLYLAKEAGRNQIVWHKGGIPPLCYVAYDTTVLKPVHNAGRRFSDATADINIKKV